jgi:hypothetical protein
MENNTSGTALFMAIALAIFVACMSLASACPSGTHPYGGYGSRHAGGGCY